MTDKFLFEPRIFYGILHAASCHIDINSGKSTALTLWLETVVLRLIQERLQDHHAATEDIIGGTIIFLALFTPFRMNIHSSAAHVRALLAILESSECSLYAEEIVPKRIVQLASTTLAMVFDYSLITGANLALPFSADPRGLLLAAMKKGLNATPTPDCGNASEMVGTLQDIYNAIKLLLMVQEGELKQDTVQWIIFKGSLVAQYQLGATTDNGRDGRGPGKEAELQHFQVREDTANESINRSCRLAATIIWMTIDEPGSNCFFPIITQQTPARKPLVGLDCLACNLKRAVAATNVEIWLRRAPLLYSWVSLTEAAVAQDMELRAWFSLQYTHAALVSSDANFPKISWSYFA